MDLKNAINNTNAQKENIKTVANNIDNKLIELGGERATDLADVPNKIQKMRENYIMCAEGNFGGTEYKYSINGDTGIKVITLNLNLTFVPKILLIEFEAKNSNAFNPSDATTYHKATINMFNGGAINTKAPNDPYIRAIKNNADPNFSHLEENGTLKIAMSKPQGSISVKIGKWRAYERGTN